MKKNLLRCFLIFPILLFISWKWQFSGEFLIGGHFEYGGAFSSANYPQGIWGLNKKIEGLSFRPFNNPFAMATQLGFQALFLEKFFFRLGFLYTLGFRVKGVFPLQNPQTGGFIQISGNYIPSQLTINQRHYGGIFTLGILLPFWYEIYLSLGLGGGYYQAVLNSSLLSLDTTLVDLRVNYRGIKNFFMPHISFRLEYFFFSDIHRVEKLGLITQINYYSGAFFVEDKDKSDVIPSSLPFLSQDLAFIDVSGYQLKVGLNYYFAGIK